MIGLMRKPHVERARDLRSWVEVCLACKPFTGTVLNCTQDGPGSLQNQWTRPRVRIGPGQQSWNRGLVESPLEGSAERLARAASQSTYSYLHAREECSRPARLIVRRDEDLHGG